MSELKGDVLFESGIAKCEKQEFEEAIELFKRALVEDPLKHEAMYNIACCCAILRQTEEALRYLDRAIKADVGCLSWAETDTELDGIRDNPGFKDVLERNDPTRKTSLGGEGVTSAEVDEQRQNVEAHAREKEERETQRAVEEAMKAALRKRQLGRVGALLVTLSGVVLTIFGAYSLWAFFPGLPLIAWGCFLYGMKYVEPLNAQADAQATDVVFNQDIDSDTEPETQTDVGMDAEMGMMEDIPEFSGLEEDADDPMNGPAAFISSPRSSEEAP